MVGVWISCLPHIEKGWYCMACGLSMMMQANTRTHGYWPQFCKRPSFDYKVCYSVGSTAGLPVECSIPKRDGGYYIRIGRTMLQDIRSTQRMPVVDGI